MEFLENLYKLEDKNKSVSEYIANNAYDALSQIGDCEGMALSAFYLTSNENFLEKALVPSYIARGILTEINGRTELSEIGYKAISTYPLLGSEMKSRRKYDIEFIPMILSFIASGDVPSKKSQQIRFFSSSDFLSVFPKRKAERASRAALKIADSLLLLSVAEEIDGFLFLRRENALSFAAAPEEDKLSYILYPEDDSNREKASFAFSLIFRIDGIPSDSVEKYLDLISEITGCNIDKEFLFDFGVLSEDDGIISGADISYRKTEDAIISSDFTLSYTGFTPTPLFMYFKAEKDDTIVQWKVTKDSITAALDMGNTLQNIMHVMKGMSRQCPPEALLQRVESWYEAYSEVRVKRAVILEIDEKNASLIEKLPDMKQYIESHPSRTIFIMAHDKEKEWRRRLIEYGFDMIGRTTGPAFESEPADRMFISYTKAPEMPAKREIPFSEKRRNELLASSSSLLDKLLTEDGIRFSADQHFFPAMVYGFNYSEKLSIVSNAIKSKKNIYGELADRRELTFTPIEIIKEENGEHYILTDKKNMIPLSCFFRIAAVDSIIRALV